LDHHNGQFPIYFYDFQLYGKKLLVSLSIDLRNFILPNLIN